MMLQIESDIVLNLIDIWLHMETFAHYSYLS